MIYGINNPYSGYSDFIEIDEAEYNRVKDARVYLAEWLQLEEALDLVTENYQEFEVELLSIASRQMVFQYIDDLSFSQDRVIIIRRILNLLSACRLYLDLSDHHINEVFGKESAIAIAVKEVKSSRYDQWFGYRAMEALRNHTQHRGFPIQSVLFSSIWLDIESDEYSRLLYSIVPKIRTSEIANDKEFKKSVLKEMLALQYKDGIDIRPLIREYIEGIGKIQEKIRELIQLDLKRWEGAFNDTIKKFQVKFGYDVSLAGLEVLAMSDDKKRVENTTIIKALIDRRKNLEAKNKIFDNLHKRHASNEIRN